jgi:hypothetical protein
MGRYRALAIALFAVTTAGCWSCPGGCPIATAGLTMTLTAGPSGGGVPGAEITFSGEAAGALNCDASMTETVCWWPDGPFGEGDYVLKITAPGFEPSQVNATLKVAPDAQCGCRSASLTPSEVTLLPMI